MRRRTWLGAGLVMALAAAGAGPARARSAAVVPYPVAEVWPTAVRFLRVDRGYELKEKDEPSGYVLFQVSEGGKTHKGSIELVRATDGDGREATRVIFAVPDLPRHFEIMLLDKLEVKVREDHGSPAPAPPKREKPPAGPEKDKAPRPDAGDGFPRAPTLKDLPRP